MGNSRLIKLALILGRCKVIEAEDPGGYYYGDYYEPQVSRFAYHALLEFHHQHYPVPKVLVYRYRRTWMWLARLLLRVDAGINHFYRWRVNRAKCIGIRGLNWFYHCPKCGHKLFYSPRTHPCPSCTESLAVVGNSQTSFMTESNYDPHTDYGDATDEENAEASWDDDYFDDWPDLEEDEEEDDW